MLSLYSSTDLPPYPSLSPLAPHTLLFLSLFNLDTELPWLCFTVQQNTAHYVKSLSTSTTGLPFK
ncbi:hypothetical protein EXN66_Car010713 [Channa argus]|uniref:Uncharacterized protein n=1 Tax=Channa argus TaxID=215402 RepID=A0A6G1PXS0_CHAAH|nr:hypothetical protein EXN66_Car010713 [Channa argus]